MTSIIEHFEEKILSLSLELDGAIMRRMGEESLEEYRNPYKKYTIEEKLHVLRKLEK